jgi:RsiW-degrading membrane proteinase PrsW (M82 family)
MKHNFKFYLKQIGFLLIPVIMLMLFVGAIFSLFNVEYFVIFFIVCVISTIFQSIGWNEKFFFIKEPNIEEQEK